MRGNRLALIVLAAITALTLTGCSSVSTQPDQIALHYAGGSFSSTKFAACVDPSVREMNGPGDTYYVYPTSNRTYDASAAKAAEGGPISVVSSDNAELTVPASVVFTLKTDCETLRKFHEQIGNRYRAYWGGSEFEDSNEDSIPDGWVTMLNFYVGKALDSVLDRQAQAYTWRALWNDPAAKTALEKSVGESLSAVVDAQMGGHYLDIAKVTVQKPDPTNKALKDAVAAEQAAVAKANSAKSQADADKAAAEAQIAVAKAEAAQVEESVRVLGIDGYLKRYAIDKGLTPWPNPVVAGQPAPAAK